MKTVLLLVFSLTPLAAQQPALDLSALDRLESKSSGRTNITLDSQLLKLAVAFLDSGDKDAAALKSLVANLNAVYVRGYEFDKAGQYTDADLEPLRASLRRAPWSRIVDVHDSGETSEIWVAQNSSGDKFSGLVIINAEATELTVVYVSGLIGPEDVAKLNGHLGIDLPNLKDLRIRPGGRKKEEEER
jgi:hypothetical protein